MARAISFKGGGLKFSAQIKKVDRKKVYGWTSKKAYSGKGGEVHMSSITNDGRFVLPSGSVAMASFDEDGGYVDKSTIKMVTETGAEMNKLPSVFDAENEIREVDGIEDYLNLNVKSVYEMEIEEGEDELLAALKAGKIFALPFCYRANYNADDAFILMNKEGVFMVIGSVAEFEYSGLEVHLPDDVEDDEDEDDADFDFAML